MTLQANLGPIDRVVRIVLGVVLLNVAAATTGPVFVVSLISGLFGLSTGLAGTCPIYGLLEVSTHPAGGAGKYRWRKRP